MKKIPFDKLIFLVFAAIVVLGVFTTNIVMPMLKHSYFSPYFYQMGGKFTKEHHLQLSMAYCSLAACLLYFLAVYFSTKIHIQIYSILMVICSGLTLVLAIITCSLYFGLNFELKKYQTDLNAQVEKIYYEMREFVNHHPEMEADFNSRFSIKKLKTQLLFPLFVGPVLYAFALFLSFTSLFEGLLCGGCGFVVEMEEDEVFVTQADGQNVPQYV